MISSDDFYPSDIAIQDNLDVCVSKKSTLNFSFTKILNCFRNTFRNKTNNDVHEAELDDPPFHKLCPEPENFCQIMLFKEFKVLNKILKLKKFDVFF